ncbi:hypothetical protein [Azospirillum canadense]|uniref:hypothetical protein n=1 Tax=Azospirillum canadense TaxID=403962 RepID=UPI0022272D2B|nr:hypothetical protein [Azospirillum canadense]MCW2242229.1 hypothetical protein [Azospirillum canadense]
MADHVNIAHPDSNREAWRHMQEVAELRARLEIVEKRARALEMDLDSIFNRIERGEKAELHYPNGDIVYIAAVPKSYTVTKAS